MWAWRQARCEQSGGDFPETGTGDAAGDTDLATLEILRRVREASYPGGKTALYALVASLRWRVVNLR